MLLFFNQLCIHHLLIPPNTLLFCCGYQANCPYTLASYIFYFWLTRTPKFFLSQVYLPFQGPLGSSAVYIPLALNIWSTVGWLQSRRCCCFLHALQF